MKLKALKEEIAQFQILLERIEQSQPISQLEVDLVLQKIRGFYELALAKEEEAPALTSKPKIAKEEAPKSPKKEAPKKTGPKIFLNEVPELPKEKEEILAPVEPPVVEEKVQEEEKQPALEEEKPEPVRHRATEEAKEEEAQLPEEILPELELPSEKEEEKKVEEEKVEEPATPIVETTKVEEQPPAAVVEKEVPKEEAPPVVEAPKEEPAAANKEEYEALFVFKQATDLMSRLQQKPISDLKGSIGVGQRFRYIGELFAGDASRFDEAIDYFNRKADDFNQAREYLENKLIPEGDWMKKEKQDLAKDFIKWIRRRFL
ncbi:hypothetical protein SapgrDRAFT_2387 [Saprospira grandis DSM 2844]|uniref:Uncharacterized protein n=1 Tax=Saprospira grandis DSM 2844 TaxID=694433 RepID=J1I6N6_9BACT|nr:hypothetical protein [Saprospira grandis]EJF54053.1 hypothetical protein SapgrDRAFT_2387 [Saprospira grandis DSM 2844]